MRHRVFIAINLPEDIKKKLADYQMKWPELPARWTKKENLHITLEFLGYVLDEEIIDIIKTAREAAFKCESFFINLTKIIYGPPKRTPRMIWVIGEKSEELGKLQKGSTPHITLARLKTWELQRMEQEEKPEVNEDINLSFQVDSIDVMESQLKRSGPEYIILESCPLKS